VGALRGPRLGRGGAEAEGAYLSRAYAWPERRVEVVETRVYLRMARGRHTGVRRCWCSARVEGCFQAARLRLRTFKTRDRASSGLPAEMNPTAIASMTARARPTRACILARPRIV